MTEKVVVITGGSMGLGLALAEHFREQGATVVTCARSGDVTQVVDVSHPWGVELLFQRVQWDYGRIDAVICNAAIYGPVAPLEETPWDEWWKALEINLLGTVLCCKEAVRVMRHQGWGKIVTLSGGGVKPQPNCTAYNASKGAVLRFTEALGADLVGTGIDVNAVAPGVLDTRMRLRSPMPEDPQANMAKAVGLIDWLCSHASDGVTGRLFSATWDHWWDLGHLYDDSYKMRRVVS
jgi:NAD(P)-dependent dehydrogenase (short-subunit alcohol dehydrogenase family)